MKKFLFMVMALLMCAASYAYDIAVENEEGVTIYYNYTYNGELEVAGADNASVVNIPETVTYMNRERKVIQIADYAFYSCQLTLTSVTMPNTMKFIGALAFYNCRNLTSVVMSNSITSIGGGAFQGCSGLTSIDIPNTVAIIGQSAFEDCSGLTSLNIPNSVSMINKRVFAGCSGLTTINIPDSVFFIGEGAFYNCRGLTSLNIPSSVTSIGVGAFQFCSGLTSINIPDSVTSIETDTFYGCSGLTSIDIPNTVTSIGNWAFRACSGLTSVTIPNSVTTIGEGAFEYSSGLTTVVSKMKKPCVIDNYCFDKDVLYNATLYVPRGTKETYKSTACWNKFFFMEEGEPSGETPEPQKCSKPTISYKKGQLTFNCATSGANCYYSITDSDIKSGNSSKVDLTVTYQVSVYAAKAGYYNSETAYATLCWIDVDPKTDGITNGVAQVKAQPVLIQAQDGFINITGLNEGQHIAVYQIDGKQVASANAYDGTANIVTNLSSGTVAIVKVGDKAIKVMMK